MNKETKISLPEGVKDIRFGELPKLPSYRHRKAYTFAGNIRAPFEYFIKKYGLSRHGDTKIPQSANATNKEQAEPISPFDKFDMIVEVDMTKLMITFREDNHTDNNTATVTGQLEVTPEIKELGINAGKVYSGKDLAETLKMKRIMFADRDKNMSLVKALQAFKAKVEQDIEAANDNKGNKKYVFDQNISQAHDLRFTLNWPILSGEPKVKFEVEINYDVRSSQIVFWLESVEMHENIMQSSEMLLAEEIAKFKENAVPVITT